MRVSPDALRMACGLVEREWGSSGYATERVEGSGPLAAVFVAHFDGSRFVIAANDMTGQWGYADGEDDHALAVAIHRMETATYANGRWSWPCRSCGEHTPSTERGNATCDRCRDAAAIGRATSAGHAL